jgi:hypothetical protein
VTKPTQYYHQDQLNKDGILPLTPLRSQEMKPNAVIMLVPLIVSPPTEHAARPLMMLKTQTKCQLIHSQKQRKLKRKKLLYNFKKIQKRKRAHISYHQDQLKLDGTLKPMPLRSH